VSVIAEGRDMRLPNGDELSTLASQVQQEATENGRACDRVGEDGGIGAIEFALGMVMEPMAE